MYAHQVIEDTEWCLRLFRSTDGVDKARVKYGLNYIKSAMKFHIDDAMGLSQTFNRFIGEKIFSNDVLEYMRLPYGNCWFDYYWNKKNVDNADDGKYTTTKRGISVQELSKQHLRVTLFCYFDYLKKWQPRFYETIFCLEGKFGDTSEGREIIDLCFDSKATAELGPVERAMQIKLYNKERIFPIPLMQKFNNSEAINGLIAEDMGEMTMLQNVLMLLNCKNVEEKNNYPSSALNKARVKQNKLPLFTYKTLVIKPSVKARSLSNGGNGRQKRLHLCRGHFKEFTKENPLFGKLTGLYWWEPHVRGEKKLGVVHKDYKLN